MNVPVLLLLVCFAVPILGITLSLRRNRRAKRPVRVTQLLATGGLSGALGITPLGFVAWLGAYGGPVVLPVAWAIGALLGIVLAVAAIGIERAQRHS